MNQIVERFRQSRFSRWASRSFRRYGSWSAGAPLGAVAPWLGTMVASWLVGWANGNGMMIAFGAVVAALGCSPVAATAYSTKKDRAEEVRSEARERQALAFASTELLFPLTGVPRMPRNKRIQARDDAIRRTVDGLIHEVFQDDECVRVTVYGVNDTATSMEPLYFAGREGSPKTFVSGTARGDKAFDELTAPEAHRFENGLEGRSYVSYISAPMVGGDEAYGMLTLDSTDAESFTAEDAVAMEVVSAGLAVYFAEARRGKQG